MGGIYSGLTSNSNNVNSVDRVVEADDENNCVNHFEGNKIVNKEIINNDVNRTSQSLDEFKQELKVKRELRHSAIAGLKKEITDLRQRLADEKTVNKMDQSTSTDDLGDCSLTIRKQLAESQLGLQMANSEILTLTEETDVLKKQVLSLKEVITISKTMVSIREEQVDQLKSKLTEIEESLAERELKTMSDDLRNEYDRQLENIRNLKALYEERSRVATIEKENLRRDLERIQSDFDAEKTKTTNLEEYVITLQADVEKLSSELWETKGQLTESKSLASQFEAEMTTINELSTQILMGFSSGSGIDLDKLTDVLEENRELLSEMTINEGSTEGSILPKLLFDLVVQSNKTEDPELPSTSKSVATTKEIIGNLPKVWRVLMEFLNHQKIVQVPLTETGEISDCYKSVETAKGPELVISVSKTFIKLKDLILEKKSLQKETNRLKTLNVHLGSRLQSQEKRLGAVSLELTKTWHIVGKLQRQHRQLHTHEQILRYQLQQKRRVLNELKDELEYCRHKWALAREKNNESEIQWKSLQREFAQRKLIDANNSAESGYSDEQLSDDDSELEIKVFHTAEEVSTAIEDEGCTSQPEQVKECYEAKCNIVEPKALMAVTISKTLTELKPKPETAEEMFYRLSGYSEEASTSKTENVTEESTAKDDSPETNSEEEQQQYSTSNQTENVTEESTANIPSTSKQSEEPETNGELSITISPLTAVEEDVEQCSTSSQSEPPQKTVSPLTETEEEYTARRSARLQRLEEQCRQLISNVTQTVDRGEQMNTQLDGIHRRYGISNGGEEETGAEQSQENNENSENN